MSSKKRSGSGRKSSGGRVTPKGTRPPETTHHHTDRAEGEGGDGAVPAPRPSFEADHHLHGSQTASGNARRAGRRGNR
jgi:hypothetical protein